MGNRGGRLHRHDRTLGRRRWTSKRWIACRCEFKGRRREVWGDGYTELFFLDEPTALAAGRRPCFECRREAAKAFLAAFPRAPRNADAMDEILHDERLIGRDKRLWRSRLGDLPDGAMIAIDGRAHALRDGNLLPWSFAGYEGPVAGDASLDSRRFDAALHGCGDHRRLQAPMGERERAVRLTRPALMRAGSRRVGGEESCCAFWQRESSSCRRRRRRPAMPGANGPARMARRRFAS